jgi:hypothetical protein
MVRMIPEPGQGILGGRLTPRRVGTHDTTGLILDLAGLDASTAAHEATVVALKEHLLRSEMEAQRPGHGAPRFDIGWAKGTHVFIGEVKSLNSTNEDQQIRLGVGQVLDYAHQILRTRKVIPVLVLERAPLSDRWAGLASSAGIVLTHGPSFPHVSASLVTVLTQHGQRRH